ncbi:MAG: SufE family protein [Alphaproteobacteria bacterium]
MLDFKTIVADLASLPDWEDKYAYLIDLGRDLPEMPTHLKTDATKVRGCTSQVWLTLGWEEGRLAMQAASDAMIVQGLVALLVAAYHGKTPAEAAQVDLLKSFQDLGLESHLTLNRRNGFASMVARVKAFLQMA